MPIEPYKRLTNEIDSFLSSNGLHHPLSILTLSEVETSPCDLVLKICSALAGVRLRLSLLDRLIRRSSALDLGPDDYLIIMGHLVKELRSLEHCLPDESQTFHDVCLCLQLMSHCLSKASCGDKLCRSLEELFETFVFVSNISSVDCLTAGFTLLVQILRLQWGDQLLDVVLSLITLPPVASACLPTSAYFTFTERLFLDDKQRTPQLAFLLALIGQLQDHIRPSTGYLSETVLRQILSFAFSIVGDDSKSSYSALESTPLILLSKIGQSWSACCRSLSVHSSYNFLQSLCSSAGLLDTPVWTLLEFCLEMKGSLFSVVRHSCLDTIDNLMQTHFILCEDCNSICLCEAVMSLFRQVTSATWLSRGTLSVILRIVTALFQCTPCSVSNLLPFLLWDSHAKEQDTAHQLACVASSLLYCAMDPSLSMHVSELYALIGSKLLTEKEELLCIWLSTLITLAINDYSTFGSAISQYILPSLFSSNCALVYRLIELSKTDGSTYSVPLLLTCYRLLNYPKRKITKKDDTDDTLSIIPLLQTALVCSDLQIRLDALNFLRASIQRTKISTELLQLIDVVFYCLRFNQWSLERPLRHQLCYTIFVAAARMRELKMQFVSSPSCFLDILIRMAALLLQGIYPGVPAPRLSFCLNGLYGLVMALCPSAEDGDKGILDSDSNWTIHRILNQAAWWAYDIRISQSNTDPLALSEQLCPFDPYLLVSHLFVGLSSTFEDDREFALQLCLLLRISHYIVSSRTIVAN
ncbi:unnamed protein product [Dicrocoelium dendriticum]|nr:unnamed protein product [Dicrocoelium dendriticum]